MEPLPVNKKHFKSFWPLAIIFFLAVVVAGFVIRAAYNNTLEDEINSIVPKIHKETKKPVVNNPSAISVPAK